MIASIEFHRFKALRETRLEMLPCNLVLGPNGSGKSSLIEALIQLRSLAQLASGKREAARARADGSKQGPEISFSFTAPGEGIRVKISCTSDSVCNELEVTPPGVAGWPALQSELGRIRNFMLDHYAISEGGPSASAGELARDGRNLGDVLVYLRDKAPQSYAALVEDYRRMLPEYSDLALEPGANGAAVGAILADEGKRIAAPNMSQGGLYLLAILALAHHPTPPSIVCLEEIDRGIHPRLLREVRDVLYRLSYPESFEMKRPAVQVVATTQSPYLLDLFRGHPEEVVISNKTGSRAHFTRLSDRTDLRELLSEGSLGDIWMTGILGGMPDEE